MSDNPIGPLVGAAVGLAAIGLTAKITKDILESSKEEKQKQQVQSRKRIVAPRVTNNTDNDRVERGLNKMLYR